MSAKRKEEERESGASDRSSPPRDGNLIEKSTHSLPSSSMSSFFWHPVEGYAMLSCWLVGGGVVE